MRGLNGLNYNYSKLKKEEVIYKGSVCINTRVLPLHTAYASRASARDHVIWNTTSRTVILPPPFEKSSSSSFVFLNRIIDFAIPLQSAAKTATFRESHDKAASFVRPPLEGEFPLLGQP